ncbi:MAG TPA: class IV adenylate cyclase [Candidatus Eisenbacteria bacterium]|nr:class IV adenylate cyclase [Candidatus Eisenbacteria bacterium]
MPRNVEIKARLADLAAARAIADRVGARFTWADDQVDRYFELDGGRRVKLRTTGRGAELIRYDRREDAGVRVSAYEVSPVRDAEGEACLVPTTRPLVTVRKRRELWLLDNVRIHLDTVDGLGTFLELEAVVDATHDEARCRAAVDRLLDAFGLSEAACLRASYGDLLRA